ncbi:MAG: hypothetical protein U9O96_01820 [Candidatus Thermoplasmatota archaeon]|nr:hypothetical protein [Candidatus Thermoplasmatota archaeon]
MGYAIFEIKKEKESGINLLKKDDLVSRQSITIRDAKSLDMKGESIYVKIEGSSDAIKLADNIVKENELGKKLSEKEAKPINDKIKEEEDSASEGMGFIFG